MAIGADVAVKKAPRTFKERLRKCQRMARKQLRKWTHISGAVQGESAAGDSQLNVGVSINSAALQVGGPPPDMQQKFGIVLLSENAGMGMKSSANES